MVTITLLIPSFSKVKSTATSNVNSNTSVQQSANIKGNGNVVGQSANTVSSVTSTPIANIGNLGGSGSDSTAQANSNSNVNVDQSATISGDKNIVGQSANTQSSVISNPISWNANNGLTSTATSTVNSNVGVNQNASVFGNGNQVGQQANTQSSVTSTPFSGVGQSNNSGVDANSIVNEALSNVNSATNVAQNSNVQGSGNTVGQSATTSNTVKSTPVSSVNGFLP